MLTRAIQQLLDHEPFIPFTLSLSSRTTVRIARADQASVEHGGDILHVVQDNGGESYISIRHVVSITPDPPPDEPVIAE